MTSEADRVDKWKALRAAAICAETRPEILKVLLSLWELAGPDDEIEDSVYEYLISAGLDSGNVAAVMDMIPEDWSVTLMTRGQTFRAARVSPPLCQMPMVYASSSAMALTAALMDALVWRAEMQETALRLEKRSRRGS